MFEPSSDFADLFILVLLFWIMFHGCICYAAMSVPYPLMITCWERADLFSLLCAVFSCVFVLFQYGFPGQVWYLIVLSPYLGMQCVIMEFLGHAHLYCRFLVIC